MLNLTIPEVDNIELWDEIVSNKVHAQRDKLLPFRQQVVERYLYYEAHFNSLDKILPLDSTVWSDIKKELVSCYGENVALRQAKRKIFADKIKCPYCMLNRPNTIDHYFDKSDYPEYVVFVPNLIPCCSECNIQKGTTVFDGRQRRKYIHFYLDRIPEYQFLFIRLKSETPQAAPQITIFIKFMDNEPNRCEIESHFQNLRLIQKYQEAIADRLSTILDEFQFSKEKGLTLDDLRNIISIRHRSCANRYGYNYWETCMYEGILNSPDFMELYLS